MENNTLPKMAATSFQVVTDTELQEKMQSEYTIRIAENDLELLELEKEDLAWKLKARMWYSLAFSLLLLMQNIFAFGLVFWAFRAGRIGDLAIILSALLVGTLAETAYIVRIMITWIFSNSQYQTRNNRQ